MCCVAAVISYENEGDLLRTSSSTASTNAIPCRPISSPSFSLKSSSSNVTNSILIVIFIKTNQIGNRHVDYD
jgi:hypothetical protein